MGKEGDACAAAELCPAATSPPGGVSLLFLISAKAEGPVTSPGTGQQRRRLLGSWNNNQCLRFRCSHEHPPALGRRHTEGS